MTIVGTRYPELDTFQNDIIQFGNYLQGDQCTRGGFLPIFWDAPYSYIGEGNKYLAVLHSRNKMVNAFASTEWVAGSEGAVLSRSVTSCAGMKPLPWHLGVSLVFGSFILDIYFTHNPWANQEIHTHFFFSILKLG